MRFGVSDPSARATLRQRSFHFALLQILALGGGLAMGADARAQGAVAACLFAYDPGRTDLPQFSAYPAQPLRSKPQQPKLDIPQAREFRTAISRGATAGVNFAGRFTIVGWGCGAACLDWAVIDRRTGQVRFDRTRRVVSAAHVDDDPVVPGVNRTFNALRFRRDSRLLVLQGAPQEDPAREGVTYLYWTGARFEQVGFTPARSACRDAPP